MSYHYEQVSATIEPATADTYGEEEQTAIESRTVFAWKIKNRIITLDHGGELVRRKGFKKLMSLNSLAVIAFDPASLLHGRDDLDNLKEFQLVPHALLGNGQPATLHACLDAAMSHTLDICPNAPEAATQVLTRLPLPSLRLDDIEGLTSIDWLLLDDRHDNLAILQNGQQALQDTLLIQIRVPLQTQSLYRNQTGMASVQEWMGKHGFRFYCINNSQRYSHFPSDLQLEVSQSSEWLGADLLFIPDRQRFAMLKPEQRQKLAFLLSTLYEIHDLTYEILAYDDPDYARSYLVDKKYLWSADENEQYFTLTEEYSPDIWKQRAKH